MFILLINTLIMYGFKQIKPYVMIYNVKPYVNDFHLPHLWYTDA